MILLVLALTYFLLLAAAGGLWLPALQAVTLLLSLTTAVQLFVSFRQGRMASSALFWPTCLLFAYLALFFLPLHYFPDFMLSAERMQVQQNLAQALTQGTQAGLFTQGDGASGLSLNPWGTLRFIHTVFLFANVLYLVATLSRQQKIKLFAILLSGALIVAVAGMVGEFIYSPQGKYWWLWDSGESNSRVCFGLSNHYGIYLCFFLPFCIWFARDSWKKDNKPLCGIFVFFYICLFIGVCVSFSRGAYAIALLVSILPFFLSRGGMAKKTLAAMIAFCIILLFAALVPEQLEQEYAQGVNEMGRLEQYETAPEIIADYPQGIGPLAYRFVSTTYLVNDREMGAIAHHSESTVFQYVQEWGIVGFLLWLGVLAAFVYLALECRKRGKLSRRLAIPAVTALIAACAHGQYDFPYAVPVYSFTVACLAGILLCRGQQHDPSIHSSWSFRKGLVCFLLPLVTLIYVLVVKVNFNDDLYRDSYAYGEKADMQQLSQLIVQQPTSWHTWYWLGRKSWEKGDLDFAESCFKNAAVYFPNHSKMWYYLAQVRYLQGKRDKAADAFRIYYLMQPAYKRKKLAKQARAFLRISKEELEALYYMKLSPVELNSEFLKNI